MAEPGQVEFPLRAEGPTAARLSAGQQAVGADHATGGPVAHDQVLAPPVEKVVLPPLAAGRVPCAHFADEDTVARGVVRRRCRRRPSASSSDNRGVAGDHLLVDRISLSAAQITPISMIDLDCFKLTAACDTGMTPG